MPCIGQRSSSWGVKEQAINERSHLIGSKVDAHLQPPHLPVLRPSYVVFDREAWAVALVRSRFGAREPSSSSATCWEQRSFWRFLPPILSVTVSSSGRPQTSRTTTTASATHPSLRTGQGLQEVKGTSTEEVG